MTEEMTITFTLPPAPVKRGDSIAEMAEEAAELNAWLSNARREAIGAASAATKDAQERMRSIQRRADAMFGTLTAIQRDAYTGWTAPSRAE